MIHVFVWLPWHLHHAFRNGLLLGYGGCSTVSRILNCPKHCFEFDWNIVWQNTWRGSKRKGCSLSFMCFPSVCCPHGQVSAEFEEAASENQFLYSICSISQVWSVKMQNRSEFPSILSLDFLPLNSSVVWTCCWVCLTAAYRVRL